MAGQVDTEHYALRFSKRRPGSNWSAVNVRRFAELQAAGAMHASGEVTFETRDRAGSEDKPAELKGAELKQFHAQATAWAFFEQQPPGYRRQASWYVMSARTPATKHRRLLKLIQFSSAKRRLLAF